MINKRLLIKNLLTYNDENSFYDKKRKLNLSTKEGKAKFLKHVCALSNSNPENHSFIVVGVEDEDNKIEGVDFFDDSKIQNLINSYFKNPPKIQYENVAFPRLPRHKVVGLVIIYPNNKITSLKKPIWKYASGNIFYRRGSNSMSTVKYVLKSTNKSIVEAIEKNASNNISLTLDSVFYFFEKHKKEYNPTYRVFNEQFVLCWAGKKKIIEKKIFYSRVDIELVSEQVRLFYSVLDEVKIEFNQHSFIITEYIFLKINNEFDYYPFEKTIIHFKNNGKYDIVTEMLFNPPEFNKLDLHHLFNNCNNLLKRLKDNSNLSLVELEEIYNIPTNYLICVLNNVPNAYKKLIESKVLLKALKNTTGYLKYKEALRILRKIKYSK